MDFGTPPAQEPKNTGGHFFGIAIPDVVLKKHDNRRPNWFLSGTARVTVTEALPHTSGTAEMVTRNGAPSPHRRLINLTVESRQYYLLFYLLFERLSQEE